MADQWYGGQSNTGERWNVNLPAVVGVVFVFLLGVVIWVIVSSGDDDPESVQSVDSTAVPVTTTVGAATTAPPPTTVAPATPAPTAPPTVPATVPPATSPQPMPVTAPPATAPPPTAPPPTQVVVTVATTVAPTTLAPTTTAAPAGGDLGVPGHPIQRPACDGGYITIIGSAIGDQATAESLDALLDRYAGSNYLRTDQTCPSLTPAQNGQPIYVIYFGPYAVDSDACAARAGGPSGSYVRRLSSTLGPDHSVTCA